ncbi:GNAT family N-acetyltransferase [Fulvivirga ulvae]|uniref:GNAT family N-acetyltransferase n=1 Tax=Fulvivirga ulvae TaxID=2904245 RepID=UPI001F37FAF8|nr:GNAT family N-acetyltransferase [Fulvivirga ulvae]UII31462.1 GNAT family N-acetyltransferase [Fulvivirga ulvae]
MSKMQLNTGNLHALWKVVGSAFNGYAQHGKIYQSCISGSEWPNRIWTTSGSTEVIMKIKSQMVAEPALTFSRFTSVNDQGDEVQGFIYKSTQYGMSLDLRHPFKVSRGLTFRKVETTEDVLIWCNAFKQAFGYKIGADILELTKRQIPYFLVIDEEKLVGVVMLYITGSVAGIHSLGIIQEMRKKGYATDIMHQMLNQAMVHKATTATLQASEMAKRMYQGMGFSTDFLMHNYTIEP